MLEEIFKSLLILVVKNKRIKEASYTYGNDKIGIIYHKH